MDEKREAGASAQTADGRDRDQELFDAIGKQKRRKRVRRTVVLIVILALVAGGLYAAVRYGRAKVREQVDSLSTSTTSVESYTVNTGSVVTTVSGSGQLTDADTEALRLPEGVKVDEMLVYVGQSVREGDYLATVEPASVMKAMSDVQKTLTELDKKLRTAANEAVPVLLTTQMPGRVKIIYAEAGDDVAACMVEHGALAVLSVDGYMAADIETDALTGGQEVKVVRANGKTVKGSVERAANGTAVVLVTDNGPMYDEEVTVLAADGSEAGRGKLYIHEPLRITGYAGTIHRVNCKENQYFNTDFSLFSLRDTAYSANYESILRQRREAEDTLLELLAIYQCGAVTAPFDGTVSSIEYKKNSGTGQSGSQGTSGSGDTSGTDLSAYGGTGGDSSSSGSTGGSSGTQTTDDRALLTLSRDERMSVKLTVDEKDILSLELGQEAQITINSIGEVFTGEVTEIERWATGSNGVTSYTATITMPKDPRMLPGMSARAVVRIQGVAGAILIPEQALHQTRDSSFVYTSVDPETGEPAGPVSVVPGLSDGSMVEITEGLSEGDTVYYTVVTDPWAFYYGSSGDASGGSGWVDVPAEGEYGGENGGEYGDAAASDGDAGTAEEAPAASEG